MDLRGEVSKNCTFTNHTSINCSIWLRKRSLTNLQHLQGGRLSRSRPKWIETYAVKKHPSKHINGHVPFSILKFRLMRDYCHSTQLIRYGAAFPRIHIPLHRRPHAITILAQASREAARLRCDIGNGTGETPNRDNIRGLGFLGAALG